MAGVAPFITFEGGEGAGKSTQVRLLKDALVAAGILCLATREPGGTPGAEAIRAILLGHEHDWSPKTEGILFAAARCDHVESVILPAIRSGTWILCDRYVDSTRAYQAGLADNTIMQIHGLTASLIPGLSILLDIPEDILADSPANPIAKRLAARGGTADRMESKDADFHAGVRQRFRDIAARESGRWIVVDALGTVEEVHRAICAAVSQRYGITIEPVL